MCSTCRFILSGKGRRGGVGERREGVGGGVRVMRVYAKGPTVYR